jgi:integrase
MAQVTKKKWRSGPRKVRKIAWGYTLQVDGKQVKKFDSRWTQEDAQNALAAAVLKLDVPRKTGQASAMTFGQAVETYLKAKARKKSLANDELYLKQFKAEFGAETPLADITADRVSAWKANKLAAKTHTGKLYAAASINRPLAALRHLLQLAHEEWCVLPAVPRIRLEKEPEGRIHWLGQYGPDEEDRLLAACAKSKNRELVGIVTIALETGLRRGELLGLTWDRVDLSRGVLRLEVTKSGRRREVPMRQAVYDVLAGQPAPREGRVFKTRSVRTAFENAVEAAGLEDFHLHDCRHHFASWFMMRGGDLLALRELLGHRDLKMTQRYAHLAPEHLRAQVAKTERRAKTSALSPCSAQNTGEGEAVRTDEVRLASNLAS